MDDPQSPYCKIRDLLMASLVNEQKNQGPTRYLLTALKALEDHRSCEASDTSFWRTSK